jgi:deazaflavin-dependent oxidoreductase (nitroreductase family)
MSWTTGGSRELSPTSRCWSWHARLDGGTVSVVSDAREPRHPPPWFVHTGWRVHRALYRLGGERFLWTTSNKRGWGSLRLTTIGRKSGKERSVIIGYLDDGPNLVALAMNGFDEGHPSWWLNLEEHPGAVVRLTRQPARPVRARLAAGEERDRLWQRWVAVDPNLDALAGRRTTTTPVIVLEPDVDTDIG